MREPNTKQAFTKKTCLFSNYDATLGKLVSRVWLFCDPMDCSPPGSSVRGISQARILEWVAISSFRGSSSPRDWICVSSVPYIGRGILYPCPTWEALFYPYSYFRRKLFHNVPSNEECFYETAELIEELSSLALVLEPQMVHRPI